MIAKIKEIISPMKKADLMLCGVILAAALVITVTGISRGTEMRTAVVTRDGEVVCRYDLEGLKDPISITVEGNCTNVITFGSGWAEFTESDCPHKDCVHTGRLDKSGDTAVCLENKVILTIEGAGEVDGVTQ